jgi:hypothetical protein
MLDLRLITEHVPAGTETLFNLFASNAELFA